MNIKVDTTAATAVAKGVRATYVYTRARVRDTYLLLREACVLAICANASAWTTAYFVRVRLVQLCTSCRRFDFGRARTAP